MSGSGNIAISASPPKARLTFRVGVVGHRPNRLKPEDIPSLSTRLAEVLSSVKKTLEDFSAANAGLFAEGAPRLRAVSSLAEGTDRYFARAALQLGYELCCPLPFHKDEFENDFKPGNSLEPAFDSVADFNNILEEARAKSGLIMFELDGVRAEAAEAYANAGRVVLNQSDLLVVVWDGGDNNKQGGTYETLSEALVFHVPVLWIDARAPHAWQLLQHENDLPVCAGKRCVPGRNGPLDLTSVVNRNLQPPLAPPPGDEHGEHTPDLRSAYFAENKRAWNWGFVWKLFRDLVGSCHFRIQKLRVRDFEESVGADWPKDAPGVAGWVNTRLVGHYAWSDKLADFYADQYRSSFVLCYLLGALAVMLALLPLLFGWSLEYFSLGVKICSGGELLAVWVILFLVRRGNKRHWHDRWMAYRLVAELVRQLRFLIPLGGGRPFPRLAQHLGNYGNPSDSWMYWHLRAIDREVGIPNIRISGEYLKDCLGYVTQVVDGQIAFHRATAERSQRIHHRLHSSCLFLFGLTFVMIATHFVTYFILSAERLHWEGWTFFAGFLPAIGAGFAAIDNQGEFARISKRSRAMAERLEQMNNDLKRLLEPGAVVHSRDAANDALRLAQTMVDEVLDWRVVFLDRPLTPA